MKGWRGKRLLKCDRVRETAVLLLWFWGVILSAGSISAQVSMDWEHSLGDIHRGKAPVAFHARLENHGAEHVTVVLEGTWQSFPDTVIRRVELAAGARKELFFYLGPAELQRDFTVRLRTQEGTLLEEVLFNSVWVDPKTTVVGILGRHPMGWGTLQSTPREQTEVQPLTTDGGQRLVRQRMKFEGKVVNLEPHRLPHRMEALGTLDVLIWPDPEPWELTGEQTRALAHWVEAGGHLVLATTAGGDRGLRPFTDIYGGHALAPQALPSLNRFGHALGPLPEPMAVVVLVPGKAQIWLEEPWGALAASERRGGGLVTVLGFNPGQPPVSGWAGLGNFWLRVLEEGGWAPRTEDHLNSVYSSNYYQDHEKLNVAAIARSLVARQASAPAIPFLVLGLIILIYLLLIGPGEYLAQSRFRQPTGIPMMLFSQP